jgi:deoxyribodipyrimidine photo-lyase
MSVSPLTANRATALDRLASFVPVANEYAEKRNIVRPPYAEVSRLSPYIRCRLVQEREVAAAVLAAHPPEAVAKFVQEILWRTYWKGWLEMRPQVWADFLARVERDAAALTPSDAGRLEAARRGETDIACFNHWARELVTTGYLHNHARMWFASIWIFTLRLPWSLGASFFLSHLLDGDPASNTLSWRWVAGLQTKGKHYLARAENIARHTDGLFNPRGQLNERAGPLQEDTADTTVRPLPGRRSPTDGARAGLLLTGEDLTPELSGLRGFPFVSLAAGWDATLARRFGLSAGVTDFTGRALRDALRRAGEHFNAPVHWLADEAWIEDAVAWAQREGLRQVVTLYPPVGPWANRVEGLERRLAELGITLTRCHRTWDEILWPLASRGFFPFRKAASWQLGQVVGGAARERSEGGS